jgi:hypothetical protein
VPLQYFSVVEIESTSPGNLFEDDAPEFYRRIERDIEDWLSSRLIPEDHIRFFHRTSSSSVNSILQYGIHQPEFQGIGDFGAGFYCADNVQASLRFATLSALEEGSGRQRASVIYFDVKNDDLNELTQTQLNGDEWTEFTQQCLRGKGHAIAYAGERSGLQLVKGELVRNPHQETRPETERRDRDIVYLAQ